MTTIQKASVEGAQSFIFGQLSPADVPKSAVRLDLLKGFEIQLQRRGVLPELAGISQSPLWFYAETERNVALWRACLSILNKDDFEFWVDVPKLIEKRVRQTFSTDQFNPFLGLEEGSPGGAETEHLAQERHYLSKLLEVFDRTGVHIHALSKVGHLAEDELSGGQMKPIVLIPTGLGRKVTQTP